MLRTLMAALAGAPALVAPGIAVRAGPVSRALRDAGGFEPMAP